MQAAKDNNQSDDANANSDEHTNRHDTDDTWWTQTTLRAPVAAADLTKLTSLIASKIRSSFDCLDESNYVEF